MNSEHEKWHAKITLNSKTRRYYEERTNQENFLLETVPSELGRKTQTQKHFLIEAANKTKTKQSKQETLRRSSGRRREQTKTKNKTNAMKIKQQRA